MSFSAQGDPVHGEVISTDASGAGVAVTFYPMAPQISGGVGVARAVTTDEFVYVTDVILISTAGGVYDLVFYPVGGTIAAGAGLHIVKGNADALGGIAHHFETPLCGPKGYRVGLIAAAGQVDLIVSGSICKV